MKAAPRQRKTPAPRGKRLRHSGPAKVRRPRLAAVYARKRLFQTLDSAHQHHRIAWIAGPPGAGKTALVSSYVEARSPPCLWYQVDESDNDVASFFHYFEQAIHAALPRQRKPLPRLTPGHLPTLGAFARRYFHAVFARFPQDSVWVFDNYHALPAEAPLHEVLREGLTGLPPAVNVIIMSRNDPPPVFARLNVHNHLVHLDAQALKLTPEEAAGLAQQFDHKLPRADIQRINEQADGWTAGVVLLLSRHGQVIDAAEQAVPLALFDYFAGEVFHHMDAGRQQVLRASALLPAMTPASVEQLTGESSSGAVLADLARRNYFTVRSAQVEATYQYHALFRAFLLREAAAFYPPERLATLRRQAAALLEAEGRIEDAVEVLREAAAWDDLARVIVSVAPVLAAQARLQTLATWIALLPAESITRNAWLLYWLAQCRMMTNPAEARACSEQAYALFDLAGDPAGLYLSWASAVYTYAVGWQDLRPLDRWLDLFTSIEARHPQIPSAEITARVTCSMLVALTHRQPRHPNTERWTQLATAMANSPGNSEYRVMLAAYLGIFYTWSGPFVRGDELIALVRPLLAGDLSPTIQILWQCFVGMHASARTADVECLSAAVEARRIAQESKANAMDNIIGIIGIHACLAMGEVRAAETWVTSTDALHDTGQIDYAVYYYGLSLIAMHKGQFQSAAEYARKSLTLAQQFGNALPEGVARIGLAQALFELGQAELAREQLALAWALRHHIRSELLEYLCWF